MTSKENRIRKLKRFTPFVFGQVMVLGLLFLADQIFGFAEAQYLNTYVTTVLFPWEPNKYNYVARMVSISATFGIVTNLLWGIVSDNTRSRFGRRRPFILFGGMISGIMIAVFGFSYQIAGGFAEIAYIYCIIIDGVIIAFSSNAYYVAERSLLPDLVEPELRGRANGIVEIIGYIGMIIIVAAVIVADILWPDQPWIQDDINRHYFLLGLAGGSIFLISIFSFFLIKEKPISELPPPTPFFKDFIKIFNFKELAKNKEFLKIILAMIVYRVGIMIVMPYIMIYLTDVLGLPTLDMLIAIGAAFGGMFILILVIGRISDRFGRKRFLPLMIIITSVFFVGMPFVQGGWTLDIYIHTPTSIPPQVNLILLLILVPFVVNGILGVITPMQAWSQDLLPEESRGKFLGILNIVFTIPQIAGSWLGAAVANNYGVEYIFWLAPIFFLLSIPLFLWVKESLPIDTLPEDISKALQ
jgi:MFS family permease